MSLWFLILPTLGLWDRARQDLGASSSLPALNLHISVAGWGICSMLRKEGESSVMTSSPNSRQHTPIHTKIINPTQLCRHLHHSKNLRSNSGKRTKIVTPCLYLLACSATRVCYHPHRQQQNSGASTMYKQPPDTVSNKEITSQPIIQQRKPELFSDWKQM